MVRQAQPAPQDWDVKLRDFADRWQQRDSVLVTSWMDI
jgi:hypothetical protein